MRDEIRRLQREFSISTVHITHDQEEALSMADRVAVMEAGRLVQIATPLELYDQPATRSVANFVGEANLWEGETASSTSVRLPFGLLATAPHDYAPGRRVTVLVRPENITVGPGPDGINVFKGGIVRDRFLGAVRRYDLAVGEAVILGQTGIRGDIDAISIRPEHIRLLPT
jgi:putative spermidine/putrescine transport system ATP-binding protein